MKKKQSLLKEITYVYTITVSYVHFDGRFNHDNRSCSSRTECRHLFGGQLGIGNTERNVRDKDNTTLTPEDQKETKKDIKITAHIRKTVVRDKSLSIDAQNAKIITRSGVVTLRGPVASEAESKTLQKIAKKTRGVVRVDNQLENKAP